MSGRGGRPRAVVRRIGVLVILVVAVVVWQAFSPQTAPWRDVGPTTDGEPWAVDQVTDGEPWAVDQVTDGEPWAVDQVIDGDTLDVRRGDVTERVRLIAVDTPERDRCGYAEARDALAAMVGAGPVWLVAGSSDDRDGYDRLLRYVEVDADGGRVDVGQRLLERGLAVAVFDSRRGYPRHDREDAYIAADEAAPDVCPDMGDR